MIRDESALADAHYRDGAQRLNQFLSLSLAPLAAGDAATLQAALDGAMRLNPDLAVAGWDDAQHHIAIGGNSAVAHHPAWFGRLAGIAPLHAALPVALDGGASARLTLTYSPTLAVDQVWRRVATQLRGSGANLLIVLLIYSVLGMILAANRKMLRRLEQATERFKRGDYGVRMAVAGPLTPEARALADTFNNMAGEVQELVLTLRASQKKLGDQLARTLQMQTALQKISWQNYHDILTDLPNRTALAARFEQALFLARERQHPLTVCLFDLDHFQNINERFGNEAGDDILRQVAGRLHGFAAHDHYSARLGGDEFVILLSEQTTAGAIEATIGALIRELSLPYRCNGQPLAMSVSAGVAVFSGNEISTDTLLRHADQALYQAKLTGRNRYHFFDADQDEEVRTHHNQRTEIRQGLLAGEFRLFYQPKVNLRSGAVTGMEALLRWQHPQRGLVGPIQFLPIVEHDDLIVDIGDWVLRAALRQMQQWARAGQHWIVSVNIAARHFQRADFVTRLQEILADFPGVPASMLELEILESSALDDIEHVQRIMTACQALGISFALDDFGTGYSSMNYLKRLPANTLKIDQSFVRNMLDDEDDLHLVSAVIGLARSFHMDVIAEGVETTAHGSRLMALGCDLAQGYGIARPMPADAVQPWAAAWQPAPEWRKSEPKAAVPGSDPAGLTPDFAPGFS